MTITDAVLRGAVSRVGQHLTLTLDPAFQGLPETAHGGSVLAVFDALAAVEGARVVVGHYHRRVPLATPLRLDVTRTPARTSLRLLDADATLLVDGHIAAGAGTTDSGNQARGGVGGVAEKSVGPTAVEGNAHELERAHGLLADFGATPPTPPRDGFALPVSRTCFACGVENELGLRVQLRADEHVVGGAWTPRPELAAGDGALAPVALTTLLDEAAFWLGALATGESGMTTELIVTLHRAAPAHGPVVVAGARAAVRQRADDGRYWDTRVEARDAGGALVASAAITFVAVRGAARRLATGLLAINPPELLRRVFPAYVR